MNGRQLAAIGIDLGTYNSTATSLLGDEVVMLRSAEGRTDQGICFPSFVEFDESGEPLRVGEFARRAVQIHPERVVWGVKRLIGKSFKQVKKSGDLKRFQYRVAAGKDGSCRIRVGEREYSPTEISALVLKKIKEDAESDLNPLRCEIGEATITVPAYFGPFQRAATEEAARLAGFERVHLIPEPTAAALAYKLRVEKKDQFIAVVDLGAGTLDVTIALLYLDDSGNLQTAEKGHGGDTALGGVDFDDAILRAVEKTERLGRLMKDPHGRAKLRLEIERAKIALSTQPQARITVESARGDADFVLRREQLDAAVAPVIDRCRNPIRIALEEADVSPGDLSHVLLVGGPTQMPAVRRALGEEFRDNPAVAEEIGAIATRGFPVNPMEAVGTGAVLGAFGGITPHAYGVQIGGSYFELIPRRTRYPCSNSASQVVPGRKRSLTLNLIQQAVDPQSYEEVHYMLGVFQFDYRPENGQTGIQIEAEYTDNGVLNLQIVQPSTMVTLPLYSVSKLEGRKVSKPSTPVMLTPPTVTVQSPAPPGQPSAPMPADTWTQAELDNSIRAANRLIQVALTRVAKGEGPGQAGEVEELVASLRESVGNSWEQLDIRTPRIRNLNRALLNALFSHRLINRQELQELQKGIA